MNRRSASIFRHGVAWGCSAVFVTLVAQAAPPDPEWIWHDNPGGAITNNEVRVFRKTFTLTGPIRKAKLAASGDDRLQAFVNGRRVLNKNGWTRASVVQVAKQLHPGKNLLALRGQNGGSVAAVIAQLDITLADGKQFTLVTDGSWVSSAREAPGWEKPGPPADDWQPVKSFGKLGVGPWGDVMNGPQATPARRLTVAPGFKVERIHSAEGGEGSWICMTVDPQGRLIISPQSNNDPLLRVTLDGAGQVARLEPIPAPIHQAMGLAYAHDSLYANATGPKGIGIYRLIDANGNDRFDPDEVHFLKQMHGSGEHGYHAIVPGPDGMIYVMNGNHTRLPDGLSPDSPHKNYREDFLLPRQWDANGHAVGVMAPGGHILRTDPEGRNWELMLAGFRNSYDFDISPEGEFFAFDADMEWDWGLPWYRPTRVNHAVNAAEFGWRSGSSKWPPYFPDSLPAVVNIGIGSPTGVKFGTAGKLPPKYQRALFIEDWSYGRLIAVHLHPHGASYTGTFETIVRGKPLNLTDLEFGRDGALYFITGGRGTQSGLYRLTWTGPLAESAPATAEEREEERQAAQARALRHRLEAFHGRKDPKAIEVAWPYLNSDDRFIRYAARIAIEWQDPALWQERALNETQPVAAIHALLALARTGNTNLQSRVLEALGRLPVEQLDEEMQLAALRVLALTFIRLGPPTAAQAYQVATRLDPYYPTSSSRLNHELCRVLVYLEAPKVIDKTLALLESSPLQEDQIFYLFHLRTLARGWTIEQRRRYFAWWQRSRDPLEHPADLVQWFRDVDRDYSDGASFNRYLANIHRDAVETLTSQERLALGKLIELPGQKTAPLPATQREFVKEWTMDDFAGQLEQVKRGRSFERGRLAFLDAQCLACHRFGNQGGSVGPELTAVSSKYNTRDLLESILTPSKVISDQYQNTKLILKEDEVLTGRLLAEDKDTFVLLTDPLTMTQQTVKKADVAERRPSEISAMPEGLVSTLKREEILDLLAYLEAAGKRNAPAFAKQSAKR